MREILFRGKSIEEKWVYGYYAVAADYLTGEDVHVIFPLDTTLYPSSEFPEYEEVDPETVGQYTGLKDSDGHMIFEGDIVIQPYYNAEVVKYRNGLYYPFINFPEYRCWDEEETTVIGNIHDNPELV